MIKRTNPIFAHLCAAALLATGTADAVVKRVDLFKREFNGTTQFIYCMSDYHIENVLKGLHVYKKAVREKTMLELNQFFRDKLTALTVPQGKDLVAFAKQLGAGQFVLINEDLLAFDENNKGTENFKSYFQRLREKLMDLGWGGAGFLPYSTYLFKGHEWPVINADSRQIEMLGQAWDQANKDKDDLKARYLRTLADISKEIDASTAPAALKVSSMTHLTNTLKNFTSLLSHKDWPSALPKIGTKLVEARVPHLIWEQTEAKHIFVLLGEECINNLLPALGTMDYKFMGSWGNLEDNAKTNKGILENTVDKLDVDFMDTVAIDLQKIFSEIRAGYHGASAADSKQAEAQNINTLLTQPIANNNENATAKLTSEKLKICTSCAKSQGKMLVCSRCKAINYCTAECQKSHWKTHKKVCKGQ